MTRFPNTLRKFAQKRSFKESRYSNGHKYPKQKQRTPNLTSFAQIGLAIMFTTNICVKHRILHVLRDADAISHVKTGEINADVLIPDVIRKCNFKKKTIHSISLFCTVTHLEILHAALRHKYRYL